MRASSVLILFGLSLTSAAPIDPLAGVAAVKNAINELENMNPPAVMIGGGKRNQIQEAVTDPLGKRTPQVSPQLPEQLLNMTSGLTSGLLGSVGGGIVKRNPQNPTEILQLATSLLGSLGGVTKRIPQNPTEVLQLATSLLGSLGGVTKRTPQDPSEILQLATSLLGSVGGGSIKRDIDTNQHDETITSISEKRTPIDPADLSEGVIADGLTDAIDPSEIGDLSSDKKIRQSTDSSSDLNGSALGDDPSFAVPENDGSPVETDAEDIGQAVEATYEGGTKKVRKSTDNSPSDSELDGSALGDDPSFAVPENDGSPVETDAEDIAQAVESTYEGDAVKGPETKREAQGGQILSEVEALIPSVSGLTSTSLRN